MNLFQVDEVQRLRREDAADRLRALADALASNNVVQFQRPGAGQITVRVPDEVNVKIEVELGADESELEIELTW
jgi:amphi-Trp domain-containing protein